MEEVSLSKGCANGSHPKWGAVALADAVPRTVAARQTEGFGLLTEIERQSAHDTKPAIPKRPQWCANRASAWAMSAKC